MLFGYLVLLTAIILSSVSAFYSVAGLAAIFAGSGWPIIIMGTSLEAAKIVTAVWLHVNWQRSSIGYKLYLVPALVILMMLTSIGVYGLLSKSHLDQNVPTGNVVAQVQLFDDKIQTEKENISANKAALKQLDAQVDQLLSRSSTEDGAGRSANLRRSQQRERATLLAENQTSQNKIAKLMEERQPVAQQLRTVESEVGPIKYVAALVYGDNPDANVLERAVRWVIILIVMVFDPLAIMLILAGTRHLDWKRNEPFVAPLSRPTVTDTSTASSVAEFFSKVRKKSNKLDSLPAAKEDVSIVSPRTRRKAKSTEPTPAPSAAPVVKKVRKPKATPAPTPVPTAAPKPALPKSKWVLLDPTTIDPYKPTNIDVNKVKELTSVLNTSAATTVKENKSTVEVNTQEANVAQVAKKKRKNSWFPETKK